MKHFLSFVLFLLISSTIMAGNLVMIKTSGFAETKQLFKDNSLQINYYRDNLIIGTTENPVAGWTILDRNAWAGGIEYYLLYVTPEIRESYSVKVAELGDVIGQEDDFLLLRISQSKVPMLQPAYNDGMIHINNTVAKLPSKSFSYTDGTLDFDPFVAQVVAEVNQTNLQNTVQHLEDYGTRNCYQPTSVDAQNWIKAQFESFGLPVEIMDFPMSGGNASDNVIATKVGSVYPDEFVIIGAHYDSYSYSGAAPGADDNATGIAGVIEAARILSQYDIDRTVVFCAFSGEEYGLYGSDAYATRCNNDDMNILGYFNIDMSGYLQSGSYIHTDVIAPASAAPLKQFYTDVCAIYLPDFIVESGALSGGDSDHTSFNQNGYMGIFPFEDSQNYSPHIHSSNDLIGPSVNNFTQVKIFTQASIAGVVSMANRLLPPQNLVGIPGDAKVTLSWDAVANISQYNIYRNGGTTPFASTTNLTYEDVTVQNGTQYTYYVTCIYTSNGQESDPSNLVSVVPMPPIALPITIDFENGAPYWTFDGSWGMSTGAAHSPTHSITESPSGQYANDLNISATIGPIDMTNYTEVNVNFWIKHQLESGYDYVYFEATDDGNNWDQIAQYNGAQSAWVQKTYSLNQYLGKPFVKLRFRFTSDYYVTQDGMNIDDFVINATGGLQYQSVAIPAGWSGFSSYITPTNAAIENVMQPIQSSLIVAQTLDGIYWPSQGVNTIGNFDTHEGYMVKTSDPASLQIGGQVDNNRTINMVDGWNLIPVLSECNADMMTVFQPVGGALVLVKEVAGTNVYWPSENISTLNTLETGKAYLVKINNTQTITYPACKGNQNNSGTPKNNKGTMWNATPTAMSHVISLPGDAYMNLPIGSEIGVFSTDGTCYGSVGTGDFIEPLAIMVFGNDLTTAEKDGFDNGDQMILKLMTPEQELFNLIATFETFMPNTNIFQNNGISKLVHLEIDYTGISSFHSSGISITPNPTSGIAQFTYDGGSGTFDLSVISAQGTAVLNTKTSGNCELNLSGLNKGVYFVRIKGNDFTHFEKIILQ